MSFQSHRSENGLQFFLNGKFHPFQGRYQGHFEYVDPEKRFTVRLDRPRGVIYLETTTGVKVVFNGRNRVAITLDGKWKDKVCGLCGDFDMDHENDFMNRDGKLVNSPIAFGKSWISDLISENNHPEGKFFLFTKEKF